MIKAVIFDMDGLMVDSELFQSMAFKKILKRYGIEAKEEIVQVIGIREVENWEIIKKKYGLKEDTAKLMKERGKIYIKILKEKAVAMPGLYKLIDSLKKSGYKIALASSSVYEHVQIVLKKLKLQKDFNIIISGGDVNRGKPDPEVYLITAKKLSVKPIDCLVLEDAYTGVIAAKNAKMKCIAVPNKYTKNQDFSKADLVVKSLEEITIDTIKNL